MKVQIDSNNKVYVDSNSKVLTVNGTVEVPRYVVNGTTILPNSADLTGVFTNIQTIGNDGLNSAFNTNRFVGDIEFTNLTTVGNSGLSSCFSGSYVTSVSFPVLENITSTSPLSQIIGNTQASSLTFPVLKTVAQSGLSYAYYNTQGIRNVEIPMLHTVGQGGFQNCFQSSKVETVRFTSLTTISDSNIFSGCFNSCSNIKDIYFPALTTNSFGSINISQFNGMFNTSTASTSLTCTLHFPSNLSTTISGLTGYPYFSGNSSRIVLAFDLPATS